MRLVRSISQQLRNWVEEQLHKGKPNGLLIPEEVTLLKETFETQYGAIIHFLMALKQRAKAG